MKAFELFATLGLDSTQYSNGLKGAETLGSKFASGVGKVAKVATAAVAAATTATVAFATSSVKTGEEFDKSMSQVAATLGYSVDELNDNTSEASQNFSQLRDFAQKMGQTTAFSASQAAEALNYMALAGYDTQKSMSMLPTVLNLAAAGDMELAHASDMVTDAQSALGLSMDDTSKMVDQMAMTASKSNTSVSQLGEAILTIGPTAKMMAGGTERLNTVLGLMADNGIKGSEAGTHLRNMMLKLSSPTSKGQKLLKQFGKTLGHDLVFDKKTGEMRDMQDIMLDLGKAMEGMTDKEKIQTISELFNARDLGAVNALLNTSKERWEELGGAIEDSQGAADKMAKTQLDNLAGDITLFQSALEGAKIAISDQLTPTIRDFVQFGTKGVSELTAAFQEGGLSGAMEKFGELLTEGLMKIVDFLPQAVEAGIKLLEAVVSGIVQNLPQIGQAFLQSLPLVLSAAVSMGTTIVQGLADASPDLIAAAVEAVNQISTTLTDANTLKTILDAGSTILLNLLDGISAALPTIIGTAGTIITNFIDYVTSNGNLTMIIDSAATLVINLANGLAQAAPELIPKVVELIAALVADLTSPERIVSIVAAGLNLGLQIVKGLVNSIPVIISAVPNIIANIFEAITGIIPLYLDAIKREFELIWEGIKSVFEGVGEWFSGTFSAAWERIGEAWAGWSEWCGQLWIELSGAFEDAAEWFGKIFTAAWTAVTTAFADVKRFFVEDVWGPIRDTFQSIIAWFGAIFGAAWAAVETSFSTVSDFFSGVWDSITSALATVVSWFTETFIAAWTAVTTAFSSVRQWFVENVSDKIHSVFQSIGAWFGAIFGNAWDNVTNAFSNVWEFFKTSVLDKITGRLDGIPKYFENQFGGAWDKVKSAFSTVSTWFKTNVYDKIVGVFSDVKTSFLTIGENIVNGIWDGISSSYEWIKDKISGWVNDVLGWFKGVFGIASPSKVMRDQVGIMLGRGVAEGIVESIPDVEKAADKMLGAFPNPDARKFKSQVQNTFSASMDGVTDNMRGMFDNFQQTIVLTLNDRELGRAVRGYV